MGGQADLGPSIRRREQDRRDEEERRVPKPWRWTLTLRVERVGVTHGDREVTVSGELMAPTHNGWPFGFVAMRRALHEGQQQIAARLRERGRV